MWRARLRVADAGQHVGDRIGNVHRLYQLDFVTPGQLAQQGALAEADAAQAETAHVATRPAAHEAAVVAAHVETAACASALAISDFLAIDCSFGLPFASALRLLHQLAKGMPSSCSSRFDSSSVLRGGDDAHFEPAQPVDLVVVDLREGELLAQAERVVAAAVEDSGRHAAEVADAGQGQRVRRSRKSHMRSPRSVTLAPIGLPVRSRNWAIERRARVTIGFWPVIAGQVADRRVERLGVGQGLAQADVDDDLGKLRHLHGVLVAELLLSAGTTSSR